MGMAENDMTAVRVIKAMSPGACAILLHAFMFIPELLDKFVFIDISGKGFRIPSCLG